MFVECMILYKRSITVYNYKRDIDCSYKWIVDYRKETEDFWKEITRLYLLDLLQRIEMSGSPLTCCILLLSGNILDDDDDDDDDDQV